MRWSNVGHQAPAVICPLFVVRAASAPSVVRRRLAAEAFRNGDVHHLRDVQWNETRVRGPVLSFASWLRYAHASLAHARFIGKVDDDAYVHAPDLEALLLRTLEGVQLEQMKKMYLDQDNTYL